MKRPNQGGRHTTRTRQLLLAASAIAVMRMPARALTIDLHYGSTVTSLLGANAVENAINYAAQQYEEMYTNPITLNITVNDLSLGGPLGKSFGANTQTTYGALRSALSTSASTVDQFTNVEQNWPATDPTGNNSDWYVTSSQAKAIGLNIPSPASDGTFDFGNNYKFAVDPYDRAQGALTGGPNGTYDLIGTAEHELSELMGRLGGFGAPDSIKNPTYYPFDLNHYTAPGVRDLSGTAGGDYFSYDNGSTDLKRYNSVAANGDLGDWDNGVDINNQYVPDSYNAQSNSAAANTLSPVDATMMDVLGYDRASTNLTFTGGYADFLTGFNWASSDSTELNPFHGTSMLINSSTATAHHEFTSGENLELASNSDMGQSIEVSAGTLELNDAGGVTGIGMGLLIDQDGLLKVDGTGSFYSQGDVYMANSSSVTNAQAEFQGSAYVNLGNPAQGTSFIVGSEGTALVTQTDSAFVQIPTLILGGSDGGYGTYALSGNSTLAVTGTIFDAYFSQAGGSITQSDNSYVKAQELIIGYFTGATGGYLLNDSATLSIGGDEVVGSGGTGQFTQDGGTNNVTGTLYINPPLSGGTGGYDINTGTVNAGAITVAQDGSFFISGGTVNSSTITVYGAVQQTSGLVVGNVFNQATYTYKGGLFSGSFTNNGTLNIDSSMTISGGLQNNAPLSVNPGITLQLHGTGLDNENVISISGGTISGNGTKTNNDLIQGNGTFSGLGALVNNGTIAESFGSLVFEPNGTPYQNNAGITLEPTFGELDITSTVASASNNLINAGSITMNGAIIDGSDQLENASGGTVIGPGEINSSFANDQGGVVTLSSGTLTIVPNFINNGTISIPAPATVFARNGISFNTGTISLAGGTFSTNGTSFTNSGLITGYGTIDAGTITNGLRGNGSLAFSGGVVSINANVVNGTTMSFTDEAQGVISGTLNSSGSITVNGANLTVDGNSTLAAYTASNASSNLFYGNVTISSALSAVVTGGATDTFDMYGGSFTNNGTFNNTGTLLSEAPIINSGTFTQTGTLYAYTTFTNSGTATIGGTQSWQPGETLTNTAGVTTLQTDAGSSAAYPLLVGITGGTVALASPQHLAALTITGNGTLDVANNHVIIFYGNNPDPIASIAAYLKNGYAGGAWNGPGISSSVAALNSAQYGLGYADWADPGNPANLASGTIEIEYTLLGDADLSGVVDGVDFGIVAANFNKGVSRWDQGDFNYDGVVDGTDFGDLASNFNKGASGAAVGPGALSDPALVAFAQANGLMADVPEPTSASALLIAGAILARRR